ncbi:ATP-binding protein [Aquibium sp. ELW1220]|uniref:ATP-binding protein n=1 Tax=Aquibium sp. ELW1220 TaxID=2976766 RepID=UPI0025B02F04|nr:ATP-binding protein [Aquibium sp. ELW1220]MDN2581155.1 ATP-binding protein [Aquibium sp. ELW1220]
MFRRIHLDRVLAALNGRAAVALLGPRQVGKTTLALEIAERMPSVYLDLERPSDLAKIQNADLYFESIPDRLIILDEIQRLPDLFPVLRSLIDINRRRGRRTGQFLLLGSAGNELLRQSSESLAGRIAYIDLPPLNLLEVGSDRMDALWTRGGFPEAFLEQAESFDWRLDFIRTYLERDIPSLGPRIAATTLRRFWTMLAHHQGQIFNASNLAGSLGVTSPTAASYLDLMVDLLLVRRLQPWFTNVGKRLVKSPKTYVRDSGIVHALLGLKDRDDVLGHPVAGGSWEGFVIENLLAVAPNGTEPSFYRTSAGAEIDLLLRFGKELWAIEVKRSSAPALTKGFHHACDDVKPTARFLVYPGTEAFPLRDEVTALPLADLMNRLRAHG